MLLNIQIQREILEELQNMSRNQDGESDKAVPLNNSHATSIVIDGGVTSKIKGATNEGHAAEGVSHNLLF